MTDSIGEFPGRLLVASAFLAVAGLAAGALVRCLRLKSPQVRAALWWMVLLQGVAFFHLSLPVPWYAPITESEVQDEAPTPISDRERAGTAIFGPTASEPASPPVLRGGVRRADVGLSCSAALLVVWWAGMIILPLRWCFAYARFCCECRSTVCDDSAWNEEWRQLLKQAGIPQAAIPLHVSDRIGPLLWRGPGDYRFVVPILLWGNLNRTQRRCIMRHEIAHYRRGDVWKALLARLVALPHWFNPLAWKAVREIETSAEWACDDAAQGTGECCSTSYAKALLTIVELAGGRREWSSSAAGGCLGSRVRRLLSSIDNEETKMKKALPLTALLAFSLLNLVRVELVAVEGEPPPQAESDGTLPQFRGPKLTPENVADIRLVGETVKDVRALVWSRDARRVAYVHWEQPVEIHDASTWKLVRQFRTQKGVIDFQFGADENTIAYGENSDAAHIHNLATGVTIDLEAGNSQPGPVFSPDGKLVATGGYGTNVILWRTSDGVQLKTLPTGTVEGGLSPVFSPNGKVIAIGNRNSTTELFNVETGFHLHQLPRGSTQEIAFSPDGKQLAATYVDGRMGLWNVETGENIFLRETGAEELYSVDWSPSGDLLATSGRKGNITIWNPGTLTVIKELPAPEWVITVRFTPDGTRLLAAGGGALPKDAPQRKITMYGIRE